VIAARGLAVDQASGGEKSCIVYSLFLLFIIVIINSSSSISFVALLNCLCLNPGVTSFCPFLLPILLGRKEGDERVAGQCLVAACQVKLQQLPHLLAFLGYSVLQLLPKGHTLGFRLTKINSLQEFP